MSPASSTSTAGSEASTSSSTALNTTGAQATTNAHILNLPRPAAGEVSDSDPSTPLSDISTIAIKDGHVGHHEHVDLSKVRLKALGGGIVYGDSEGDGAGTGTGTTKDIDEAGGNKEGTNMK
jgi:hypothetical protein